MKLKYNTQNGEIICMGEMPNLSGDGVVDVSLYIPSEPINYFTFNGTELVRKSQQDIDKIMAEASFNIDLMTSGFGEAFTGIDAINLSPYLEAFRSYGRAKNFAGMKSFRDGLVAAGKASPANAVTITDVVAEQGINLNNY